MSKTNPGNFFEDFRIGQIIRHATPRTRDQRRRRALHRAVRRRALRCSRRTRSPRRSAIRAAPVDDLLVFHIVFGKTVPDVSLNAVANLGYAGCCFRSAGFPGDTLSATLRGDRAEGEFEPQDRHRLRAHDRLQAGRHAGARIRPLGDGAQTRRGGARAGRSRAAPADRSSIPRCWARPVRRSTSSAYDVALAGSPHRFGDYAGRRAASTTSTASRSRRPSTRSRPGSIRTPRAFISTSSPKARAASAGG